MGDDPQLLASDIGVFYTSTEIAAVTGETTVVLFDDNDEPIVELGSSASIVDSLVVDQNLFFSVIDGNALAGESVISVWRSDGTRGGTELILRQADPFGSGQTGQLVHAGDTLFVRTVDGETMNGNQVGVEIWALDETAKHTYVYEFSQEFTYDVEFTEFQGQVYLPLQHPKYGTELWALSSPLPIEGDVDGNGTVDFLDFLRMSSQFGVESSGLEGDLDQNGIVDFNDFIILSEAFGNEKPRPFDGALATIEATRVDSAIADL